jgi:hypothetical protein
MLPDPARLDQRFADESTQVLGMRELSLIFQICIVPIAEWWHCRDASSGNVRCTASSSQQAGVAEAPVT